MAETPSNCALLLCLAVSSVCDPGALEATLAPFGFQSIEPGKSWGWECCIRSARNQNNRKWISCSVKARFFYFFFIFFLPGTITAFFVVPTLILRLYARIWHWPIFELLAMRPKSSRTLHGVASNLSSLQLVLWTWGLVASARFVHGESWGICKAGCCLLCSEVSLPSSQRCCFWLALNQSCWDVVSTASMQWPALTLLFSLLFFFSDKWLI